jgi:hypothetical protein
MAGTAIVTGSDSGIGKATAIALARDGYDVDVTWNTGRRGASIESVRGVGSQSKPIGSAPGASRREGKWRTFVFRAPDTLGGSVLLRSRRRSRRLRFGRRLGLAPDGAATEQSVSEYIYGYRTNTVEPLGPRNPWGSPPRQLPP